MSQIYGVIGMGEIGGGMAGSMARAGLDVYGFDPSPEAQERASNAGVKLLPDLQSLLETTDCVVISLASLEAIDTTYEIIASAPEREGVLIIECSTIPPEKSLSLARLCQNVGQSYIDVGVIGLGKESSSGQLYFLVGGDADDVASALPFLEACGRGHQHLGPIGSAATAKVLNNGLGLVSKLALAEAVAEAQRAGLDADAFVQAVIEGNGAGASVVFTRSAHFATGKTPEPPTPLNLKDGRALGALIEPNAKAYPLLRETAQTVDALLSDSDIGLVNSAANAARWRLKGS